MFAPPPIWRILGGGGGEKAWTGFSFPLYFQFLQSVILYGFLVFPRVFSMFKMTTEDSGSPAVVDHVISESSYATNWEPSAILH